jgi:hypothetical protein
LETKYPKPDKRFLVPLFGGEVNVFRNKDKMNKAHLALGLEEIDFTGNVGIARNLSHTGTGEVLYLVGWFDEKQTTLVHELAHLTFYVLGNAGVPVENNGAANETYCYLLDNLFEMCQ